MNKTYYFMDGSSFEGQMNAKQLKKFEAEHGELKHMVENGRIYVPSNDAGTYWCPACSTKSAVWGADFNPEEMGYEEGTPGVVSTFTCSKCGASIQVDSIEE